MLPISKSTFLQFQICPKDTWLRLHKPELVETFTLTEFEKHLLEQGNEVELYARQLFPGAVLVSATGDDAVEETRRLMAGSTDAIFQATFLPDGFFVKCDVIRRSATPGTWDVFEIKGTNSMKEGSEDRDHISDLTFQKHVLELAGVTVGRANIVHLNKAYVRAGDDIGVSPETVHKARRDTGANELAPEREGRDGKTYRVPKRELVEPDGPRNPARVSRSGYANVAPGDNRGVNSYGRGPLVCKLPINVTVPLAGPPNEICKTLPPVLPNMILEALMV